MNRYPRWLAVAALVLITLGGATSARAGIEQTQLQNIKDLASKIFNEPVGVAEPGSPCSLTAPPCGCTTPACACDQLYNGSPNQKLLARTWYYGWALRNGGMTHLGCAQQELLDIINRQATNGHYSISANTDEILTTSHFQLWAAGMAGAYLLAYTGGTSYGGMQAPDTAVLTAVRKWWLDEKKLWDLLANGGNAIDAPGARFQAPPAAYETNSAYRNIIYKQLRNIRPALPGQWTDKYYTGGWILEELFERGHNPTNLVAPIGGYSPRVRVHDTLCIYRQGSEWLIYFPKLQVVLNPVFWVQNRAGQPHDSGVTVGTPGFPPVKPANFGSLVAPVSCPECVGLAAGALAMCPLSTAL